MEQQKTAREITNLEPNQRETEMLSNCRMWTKSPVNAHSSQGESQLYIFVDNEAVSTRRHLSRTHRVAHDWLFDRINLDTHFQIKYVDTKNQLANMLTKSEFYTW